MKHMLDDKGRLFGKISIIDIIVIILAVILVCAVFVRTSRNRSASQSDTMDLITYSVEVENIRQETAEAVLEGDKIYDKSSGVCMGTVKKTTISNAHKIAQKADGTYVDGEVEGRYDLEMIIEAECRVSDGRYYSERTAEINVNAEKDIQTKYAMFTGRIMEIRQ